MSSYDVQLNTKAAEAERDEISRRDAELGRSRATSTKDEVESDDLLLEDVSIDGMCGVY